ncbi:MAG: hypothetical protein JWO09_653 [Bacteroidetes bacterium]|nr:hypothetical protein [Bacteroidota bacterium]
MRKCQKFREATKFEFENLQKAAIVLIVSYTKFVRMELLMCRLF